MFIDQLKQNLSIRNEKQAKLNLCYSYNNHKQFKNQYNKQNFQVIHNYKDNSIFQSKKISSFSSSNSIDSSSIKSSIINFSNNENILSSTSNNNEGNTSNNSLLVTSKLENSNINGGYIGKVNKVILGRFKRILADLIKSGYIVTGGLNTTIITSSSGEFSITGDFNPSKTAFYSLGKATKQWKNLYISNSIFTKSFIFKSFKFVNFKV